MNSLDRAQGWVDSPLADAGKQMAEFSHGSRIYNYEKNSRKDYHGSPADFFVQQGGWI